MSATAVACQNLTVRFVTERRTVTALDRVSFSLERGGFLALLGPSGCGKSTLLNIISGLLHPSQGRILFNDKDVTNAPTTQRNIAQVFQFPVVYDTMTVRDNLAFPLRNRGADPAYIKARVQQIAAMIGMEDSLNYKARGLTADAKQKISLGRGMVREDVNALLFDEPLTVIDPHMKWRLRSQLKHLHKRYGFTMIYVTHDQEEAMEVAEEEKEKLVKMLLMVDEAAFPGDQVTEDEGYLKAFREGRKVEFHACEL